MGELQAEVAPILEIVQYPGRVAELRQEKLFTQAYLQTLGVTPAHVEVLHRLAAWRRRARHGRTTDLFPPHAHAWRDGTAAAHGKCCCCLHLLYTSRLAAL